MKAKRNLLAAGFFLAAVAPGLGQSVVQFATNSSSVPDWATSTALPDYASALRLAVRRTNDIHTTVSVDYATADGTATNGLKYAVTNGTLVFAAGETNKTIVVQLLDFNEGLVEGTKTFRVILSNPANAVLGARTTNTVSIFNVDVGVQFQFASYNTASYWPLAEDVGTVLIGVVRGDDANIPVTVDYFTTDLSAISGLDYTGATNTLTFAPQERLKFISIPIFNDGVKDAANETFRVTLANPVGVTLGSTKTTTVTIMDNDQGFAFESAAYYVAEDAGVALIGVRRGSDDTNSAVTVDYATANGSALNGLDYTGATNTLAFAPGERRKVIPIPILNDGVKEATKYFRVSLSNPNGGAVLGAPTTTTVWIQDNDPGVSFEIANQTNAWENVGDFTVTVLRGNDGDLGPITVDYSTTNLTAIAGQDYQAVSGTLEFQANETVKTLHIRILPDGAVEPNESFRVGLNNPTGGATLGTASTTVEILDGTGQGNYVTVALPFDTALTIRREWGVNVLTWAGGGQLQRADRPTGPWQTLLTATNPVTVQSPVPTTYYRVTRPRPAKLYVPSSYDGRTNLPLVLLLHGYIPVSLPSSGAWYESWMQFQPVAEARGFLYCLPEGTLDRSGLRYWNGTDTNDFWSDGVDHVVYLRTLIETIVRQFAVDRKRVYFIGHSAGGDMAFTMACASADLIAGIASLGGNTFLDSGLCQPSQPVHILCLCGTADEYNLYYGSAVGSSTAAWSANQLPLPGAARSAQMWATYNGAAAPVSDPAPTLNLDLALPGLDTVVTRYLNHSSGGAVELWTMMDGTHLPTLHSGNSSSEFSPRVIDWLLAHPKP